MHGALEGDRSIDFLQTICLGHCGKARFDSLAKPLEAFLHAANAFEQAGVDQGRHRPPVLVDDDAVVAILNLVQHVAQVLSEDDGAGLRNHGSLSILIIMVIMIFWLGDVNLIRTTCLLVTKVHVEVAKVHVEVAKMRNQAREVVMIGHKGHPEVEGTMGQSRDGMYLVETPEEVMDLTVGTPDKLSFVTQTTLSVDDASVVIAALREKFPEVQGPKKDDICYATQNRQDAVKTLAEQCDVVIVVGSPNSSNSRRLKEVAIARGVAGYLIDGPDEIEAIWLEGKQRIGVTAGASAPEILVKRVVDRIRHLTGAEVSQAIGVEENVSFPLPKELASLGG